MTNGTKRMLRLYPGLLLANVAAWGVGGNWIRLELPVAAWGCLAASMVGCVALGAMVTARKRRERDTDRSITP